MKKLKQILINSVLTMLMVTFISCGGSFRVTEPHPKAAAPNVPANSSDYIPEHLSDGRLSFTVKFSKSVNKTTVIVGQSLLLSIGNSKNIDVDLIWSNSDKQLTIITKSTSFTVENTSDRSIFYSLILNDGIQSTDGITLDGDYDDNSPGGNYQINGTAIFG